MQHRRASKSVVAARTFLTTPKGTDTIPPLSANLFSFGRVHCFIMIPSTLLLSGLLLTR
jgi:hypothetical protein